MEILAQKYVETNPKREIKKLVLKLLQNLMENWPKQPLFYRATKTSRWGKTPGQMTCRSTGRSTEKWSYLSPLGLPDDRPVDRTQVLICRSTEVRTREKNSLMGRPLGRLGPNPESKLSGSVDRRSAGPQARACVRFYAHRLTDRLTDFWLGRSSEDQVWDIKGIKT